MKTIANTLAFISGIYGIIACSIAFIVTRLLSIPLLPYFYTNEFKLKEKEKWGIIKKIFDICSKISDYL